jgi:aspartate kinase
MIVMKFGGTSVEDAKAIDRVASIVHGRLAQKPVVVVSAMAKVTDTLLTMAKAAGGGERKTALKLCRSLQERHYNAASELLGTARFTVFHSELGTDFESLDELLRGISAVGEITPRTTDHVAAFGEMLSSKIVAAAFAARGLNGAHVDSRDVLITDSNYMQAVPQFEETNAKLREKVQPLLRAGQVPVMGGFIGANRAGITTTIGRGGSDFSAAILARRWAPTVLRSGPTWTAFLPPILEFVPTPAASRSSVSTKPPSSPISAQKSCTRRRCFPPSRKIFPSMS